MARTITVLAVVLAGCAGALATKAEPADKPSTVCTRPPPQVRCSMPLRMGDPTSYCADDAAGDGG